MDLLLSSLTHTLLGCFHSSHVLPAVGGDALDTDRRRRAVGGRKSKAAAAAITPAPLTTSLQLFFIPSLSLLVMQQRAPAIRGRHRALVSELLSFARSLPGLRQTVLLTSSLAYRKADEELDAVHPVSFYYLPASGERAAAAPVVSASATTAADAASAPASSSVESLLRSTLGWNSLHHNALQQDELPTQFDQLNSAEEMEQVMRVGGTSSSDAYLPAPVHPIPVPGLGITRPFFEMVSAATSASPAAASNSSSSSSAAAVAPLSFPSLCLHVYVNEGANDRDAMAMAQSVYTMLFMQKQQQQQTTNSVQQTADNTDTKQQAQQLADPRQMIWCPPSSWNLVFGNEAEESLYL